MAKSKLYSGALKSLTDNDTELPQVHWSSKVYILQLCSSYSFNFKGTYIFRDLALQISCDTVKARMKEPKF